MPRVSIVTPVYERPEHLLRTLLSVASQTFGDFECLVIDDGSQNSPEDVVTSLDDSRFRLILRKENGGCTAARADGFMQAAGDYATTLDSDNEMYPWALERAVRLLDEHPEAGCVTGLYVFPDGLRSRISNGQRLVDPVTYCAGILKGNSDSLGVVRRNVLDDWSRHRRDYYNNDFHFWFGMSLRHNQFFVDEPWGIYHEDAPNRITYSPDPRGLEDVAKFVMDYRPEIGDNPCVPLDHYLQTSWFRLRRHNRVRELAMVEEWMVERRLRRRDAVVSGVWRAVKRRLPIRPGAAVL